MSGDLGFGEALRRVRQARGLTQAQLAERAGFTRTHLVRIEGQDRWPAHYQQLLGALGLVHGSELLAKARDALSIPTTTATACVDCGSAIVIEALRRGRPRVRCVPCASDRGALGRAWRTANRGKVDAYNAGRREREPRLRG